MKKALILIIFILAAVASFGQFVNTQTVASSSTDYKSRGGLTADSVVHLAAVIFADTTAANYSVASKYSGALIQVANGQIWWRSLNPNQWHIFASSTGGSYVLVSDTSVMLTPYLRKTDTAFMLSNRLKISDTAFMLSTRVKYSDTANQTSGYIRKNFAVLYTDTASMLSGYAKTGNVAPNTRTINTNAPLFGGGDLSADRTFGIDTGRAVAEVVTGGSLNKVRDSLQANITASVSGVSSVTGTGALSFTNPTTTPVGTIDTSWGNGLTTRLRTRQIADSLQNNINAKGIGSVTSVAVATSSAFTVTGSPITTSGTITISGAGNASQVINGLGELMYLPTTSSATFMLLSATSNISGYKQAVNINVFSPTGLASVTQTVTTTPTLMASFATNQGSPNFTDIPVGLIYGHFETQKAAGANNYYSYFELYKRNTGGTETLLLTSDNSAHYSNNTLNQITVSASNTSVKYIDTSDRIVMKIYCVMVSSSASITMYYDDNTDARFELPYTPRLGNYVLVSDTTAMLLSYLKKSDTATMLAPFVQYSDTANIVSGYTRITRFTDTTSVLRALINTKGTGTVTSVGLTAPSFLTITNSPITTSGNIVATLSNQNANLVFAGPTTGSAAQPTFRSLVQADIPSIYTLYSDTALMLSKLTIDRVFQNGSTSGRKGNFNISGTADSANYVNLTDDNSTNATYYLTWVGPLGAGSQYNNISFSSTKLSFNPSTGVISATGFNGSGTSLSGIVKYTDTATMLSNLLKISDTTTMLSNRLKISDTLTMLSNRLKISDTATMFSNYRRKTTLITNSDLTNSTISGIALGSNLNSLSTSYGLTGTSYNGSATVSDWKVDTTSGYMATWALLKKKIDSLGAVATGGTVTSIATNNGTGISGGTITTSGTLLIDTLNISTRLWRQKGIDSTMGQVNLKLNISDTSTQLSGYVRTVGIASANGVSGTSSGGQSPLLTITLGAITPTSVSASGAITGTTLGGTLTTAAQPNITSVGTLTQLTVSGVSAMSTISSTGLISTTNFIKNTNNAINGGHTLIQSASGGSHQPYLEAKSEGASTGLYIGATRASNQAALTGYSTGAVHITTDFAATTGNLLSVANNSVSKFTVDYAGNGVFAGTTRATAIIGSGAADNGIDAVQSGGGSGLFNLLRFEGKIQATSTTIDATATVWNDNTNGSTVTYTLPSTSSLQGGLFMFFKSGTGNLTLSGTIVKKDGTSAGGSMTLASTDGLQQFWFNGTTWYQIN